jgi:acetoacetyl-CoA reductase/3-oxoacyl-[acyl-carrier protein] reductase
LINNAGITRIRRFTDVRDLDWDDVMDVNLRTPFKATQALVRLAEKVNRDSYKPNHVVVNIASMGWRAPLRMSAAYCASKAALVHLTRTLAKELIDTHPYMRLYAVCPNTLEGTKMTQQVEDALVNVRGFTREAAQKYLRNNGYGKLQNPSEVAGTVSYLVTEQPEFMNGGVFEYPAGMS